jgi:hypothetical protein
MTIELKKFGLTLTSRDDGREAFSAFKPSLKNISGDELIEMIFTGVNTLSPSWADEFIAPIAQQFGDRLILVNTGNLSVLTTLDLLEKIHNIKFIRK